MVRTEARRVFVTVVDCGDVRDAAGQLFRTQSALSMTLKQVEDHLGAPLFESNSKRSLTELGSCVAGVARVRLRDHDTAINLIAQHASGKNGRLRIAWVAAPLIPEMLAGLMANRPGAKIGPVGTDSADMRRRVASGQADLGTYSMGAAVAGLIVTPIFEDGMRLVCPANSALAQRAGPVDWRVLGTVPLFLNATTGAIGAADLLEPRQGGIDIGPNRAWRLARSAGLRAQIVYKKQPGSEDVSPAVLTDKF